jgi:hypothetical protein
MSAEPLGPPERSEEERHLALIEVASGGTSLVRARLPYNRDEPWQWDGQLFVDVRNGQVVFRALRSE